MHYHASRSRFLILSDARRLAGISGRVKIMLIDLVRLIGQERAKTCCYALFLVRVVGSGGADLRVPKYALGGEDVLHQWRLAPALHATMR